MSIEKMQLVNIAGKLKNLDAVIEKCIDSKCFHIESAVSDTDNNGFSLLHEENPYRETLERLVSVNFDSEIDFHETDFMDIIAEPVESLSRYVSEISEKMKILTEEITQTKNSILQYEQIVAQLKHLHGMDIDMEKLFSCKHIHVRFGKLPVDSYSKLEYYGNDSFTFVYYDVDKDYYWGMYFAPI